MNAADWPEVSRIYAEGIASRIATFETVAPAWEQWDKGHLQPARLVVEKDTGLLAWAALSPVSSRCVYAGVAEVSVYVSEDARGKGVGTMILKALVEESEKAGIWTLQAGIFSDNRASIRIHEKAGFRLLGYRERLGQLHGVWKDVAFLERRSKKVGI